MADEAARWAPPIFDPWRAAQSAPLKHLASRVLTEAMEHAPAKRRTQTVLKNLAAIADALVSNCLYWTSNGHAFFRITRAKRLLSRRWAYSAPVLSDNLPDVLDWLTAAGYLYQRRGRSELNPAWDWNGVPEVFSIGNHSSPDPESLLTEVAPTPALLSLFSSTSVTGRDTYRMGGEQLTVLKAEKVTKDGQPGYAGLVDFPTETRNAKSLMREVRLIVKHMREQTYRYTGNLPHVDVSNVDLRRVFTMGDLSFHSGGRFAGATGVQPWWYPLNKDHRLRHVDINGEPMADLDFSGMYVQLAYARAKMPLPDMGDLYRIDCGATDDEDFRALVKQVYSACVFVDKDGEPLRQWPRKVRVPPKFTNVKLGEIVEALLRLHPAIRGELFRGFGHTYQWLESTILTDALMRLRELDIAYLPMHDGLAVPQSKAELVRDVMADAFSSIMGIRWAPRIKIRYRRELGVSEAILLAAQEF